METEVTKKARKIALIYFGVGVVVYLSLFLLIDPDAGYKLPYYYFAPFVSFLNSILFLLPLSKVLNIINSETVIVVLFNIIGAIANSFFVYFVLKKFLLANSTGKKVGIIIGSVVVTIVIYFLPTVIFGLMWAIG